MATNSVAPHGLSLLPTVITQLHEVLSMTGEKRYRDAGGSLDRLAQLKAHLRIAEGFDKQTFENNDFLGAHPLGQKSFMVQARLTAATGDI